MRLAKASLDLIQTDVGIAQRLNATQSVEMSTIVIGRAPLAVGWWQQTFGDKMANTSHRHIGQ
jgi:hypothetical protein